MRKITVDDVVELNERMIGYHGKQIDFSNGFCGNDLDLESAIQLKNILNEIISDKPRNDFKYNKNPVYSESF